MAVPVSEWTIQQAKERIPALGQGAEQNLAFLRGDHWQGGDGWAGPMPQEDAGRTQTLTLLSKSFVARNVIGEIADNHISGVLGRSPHFNVSLRRPLEKGDEPTDDEQALIDEAAALLRGWWDSKRAVGRRHADQDAIRTCSVHELLQEAAVEMLATTRVGLRVIIDPDVIQRGVGESDATAIVEDFNGNVAEALSNLYVASVPAGQGTVYVDERLNSTGIYVYQQEGDEGAVERAELCYLDPEGNTVIRLLGEGEPQQTEPLQLGGRLTMYEMERPLFLTEPLRSMQRSINLVLTLAARSQISGGFLERLFLNASMPGNWVFNEKTNRMEFVADEHFKVGEATTNFIPGLPQYDPNTGDFKGYTTPSVVYRDPVPSSTFIELERALYRAMLEEAKQLHTLISGDAAASGESRIQAKDTYQNSLLLTKPQVDAAVTWMLETLLALAADLAGDPGRYDSLKVDANAQISLGIATGEETRTTLEAMQAGALSRKTTMRRIGVEDPDAEAEELEGDMGHLLYWLGKKAEIAQLFAAIGLNEEAILDMLGISEETRQALVGGASGPAERAQIAANWVNAGASLEGAARMAGVTEEELERILQRDMVDPAVDRLTMPSTQELMRIGAPPAGGDGSDTEAPENLDTTAGLNGAQIRAVLDVLDNLRNGTTPALVAVELLIAVGMSRERAQRIVDSVEAE